jgi:hypothetical protein
VERRSTAESTRNNQRTRSWLFYLKRGLLALCALLVALPILGFGYEMIAAAVDARRFPPPGKLVAVDGHQMHINCTEEGRPTVVMDAGLGGANHKFQWTRHPIL